MNKSISETISFLLQQSQFSWLLRMPIVMLQERPCVLRDENELLLLKGGTAGIVRTIL